SCRPPLPPQGTHIAFQLARSHTRLTEILSHLLGSLLPEFRYISADNALFLWFLKIVSGQETTLLIREMEKAKGKNEPLLIPLYVGRTRSGEKCRCVRTCCERWPNPGISRLFKGLISSMIMMVVCEMAKGRGGVKIDDG